LARFPGSVMKSNTASGEAATTNVCSICTRASYAWPQLNRLLAISDRTSVPMLALVSPKSSTQSQAVALRCQKLPSASTEETTNER
jgi:hypothetical protein